jgi:hypothetical protein
MPDVFEMPRDSLLIGGVLGHPVLFVPLPIRLCHRMPQAKLEPSEVPRFLREAASGTALITSCLDNLPSARNLVTESLDSDIAEPSLGSVVLKNNMALLCLSKLRKIPEFASRDQLSYASIRDVIAQHLLLI